MVISAIPIASICVVYAALQKTSKLEHSLCVPVLQRLKRGWCFNRYQRGNMHCCDGNWMRIDCQLLYVANTKTRFFQLARFVDLKKVNQPIPSVYTHNLCALGIVTPFISSRTPRQVFSLRNLHVNSRRVQWIGRVPLFGLHSANCVVWVRYRFGDLRIWRPIPRCNKFSSRLFMVLLDPWWRLGGFWSVLD